MEIKDLNGNVLGVENLVTAIQQAEDFLRNRHADPEHKQLDENLYRYWSDIHRKLLRLQKRVNTQKNEHHGNNK